MQKPVPLLLLKYGVLMMTIEGRISKLCDDAQRIVIKVGSALLFDPETGQAKSDWMAGLAADIAGLHAAGKQVIVVSSGSIALGRRRLGLDTRSIRLEEKQAAAATGQVELAQRWSEVFDSHQLQTAQILLAPEDTETRRRHINARATMATLLGLGAVPVVNENDTVTTYEIRFGDNDRLAARVAAMMSADLLILLSDVDGLYDRNPKTDSSARHIPLIAKLDDSIMAMGGKSDTEFASGGMATKLAAAQIASPAGVDMVICSGLVPRPVTALRDGAQASLFLASTTPVNARKNWIAGALNPTGHITIDNGAINAVLQGKSLLPVGVISVSGQFDRGDLVQILNEGGDVLGCGLAGYSSTEAGRLAGQRSADIGTILGYEGRAELIHADDLVITRQELDSNQA